MRLDEYTVFPYQAGDVIFAMRNGQPAVLIDPTTLPGGGGGGNFADTDLTFDANRSHDLAGFYLSMTGGSMFEMVADTVQPLGKASFEMTGNGTTSGEVTHRMGSSLGTSFELNGDLSSLFYGTMNVEVGSGVAAQFRGGGQVVVGDAMGSTYIMEVNGAGNAKRGLYVTSNGLIAVRADETSGSAFYGSVSTGLAVTGDVSGAGIAIHGHATADGAIAGWFVGTSLIEETETATLTAGVIHEIRSTSKGSIPAPKMTGAQAEAINSGSPAEGVLVYATDGSGSTITSKGWWGYNGTTWTKLN